jgi:DNA mismatch endonuclease, patch repair protein
MAAIRSKDTKPEIAIRRVLHAMGYRFRLHVPDLPGRPDIVMKRHMAIVQVKGCFWHGHRCLKGRVPGGNRDYWVAKIAGNKARDRRNERRLRALGWKLATVWECTVRRSKPADLAALLEELMRPRRRRGVKAAGKSRARRTRRSRR